MPKKEKKVIFFGTPEFALPSLKLLAGSNFIVKAVVTGSDKKVGRRQVLTPTPVKTLAKKLGLEIWETRSFTACLSQLVLYRLQLALKEVNLLVSQIGNQLILPFHGLVELFLLRT